MQIDPIGSRYLIDPLSNLYPNAGPDAVQVKEEGEKAAEKSSFSDILTEALNNAVTTDVVNQEDTLALLSTADSELHTNLIDATKAELALNLAIQVRNKAIEAYNEIMRMQI